MPAVLNPIEVKVTTIGSSSGLVLPKEALTRLNVQKGATLYLTDSPTGLLVTPYNPDFARQMSYAYEAMDTYRDALKELAK